MMMLQSVDFAPMSIDNIPTTTAAVQAAATATPSTGAGMRLTQASGAKPKAHPPAYDFQTRDDKGRLVLHQGEDRCNPSTVGIHRVYGGPIQAQLGYHGDLFALEEHAAHFTFLPAATSLARMELDTLVQQWVVPACQGRPFAAEGIFCGQITCMNPQYAIAIMASVLQVRVYCITPKFKTDLNNGRVKGHVEFWVEKGNAAKFTSKSKGLVCCEDGGFYVATSLEGSRLMQGHSLHVPPTKVGVPQWPVTLEPRRSAFN